MLFLLFSFFLGNVAKENTIEVNLPPCAKSHTTWPCSYLSGVRQFLLGNVVGIKRGANGAMLQLVQASTCRNTCFLLSPILGVKAGCQ